MATTKTLKNMSNTGNGRVQVHLLSLYSAKKSMGSWFKGLARLKDLEDTPLWVEASGNSQAELDQRLKLYAAGEAVAMTNYTSEASVWVSGGRVVKVSPGTKCKVTAKPIARADGVYQKFSTDFPVPKGEINGLLKSSGGERIDFRGIVTALVAPRGNALKWDVWLKDDSLKETLLELWGKTFDQMLRGIQIGTIIQVDNARVKCDKGSVSLTAEYFGDGPKADAFLTIEPPGTRSDQLRALDTAPGQRVSDAWGATGTGAGFARMTADGQAVLSCASNIRSCPLPWDEVLSVVASTTCADGAHAPAPTGAHAPGGAADKKAMRLPSEVRIEVRSVFVTEISSVDPVYLACKSCNTKIDPQSKKCKKAVADASHTTVEGDRVVLSGVRVSDFSGSVVDVMVSDKAFLDLTGCRDVAEVEDIIREKGAQGLAFRTRSLVRIGANRIKKPLQAATMQGPMCDFQVLGAVSMLTQASFGLSDASLKKVIAIEGEPISGAVLPIHSPCTDLEMTPMGLKFKHADLVPEYVVLLCNAVDSPDVVDHKDGSYTVVHNKAQGVDESSLGKFFRVESMCTLSETCWYNLQGTKPRLVVGSARSTDAVVAERVFSLPDGDVPKEQFLAEVTHCWNLLANVSRCSQKRPAKDLIDVTPTKVLCTEWPPQA